MLLDPEAAGVSDASDGLAEDNALMLCMLASSGLLQGPLLWGMQLYACRVFGAPLLCLRDPGAVEYT